MFIYKSIYLQYFSTVIKKNVSIKSLYLVRNLMVLGRYTFPNINVTIIFFEVINHGLVVCIFMIDLTCQI